MLTFFSSDYYPRPPCRWTTSTRRHENQTTGRAVYSTEDITSGELGTPGIPGDPYGDVEAAYVFISDVPEPSVLAALFGLGGMGMVGLVLRRRRA